MKIKLDQVEKLVYSCAEKLETEIISIEFVLEHGMRILRIIAKKGNSLSLDDSTFLNQAISDELDLNEDLIDGEYYLEVSSEGAEKELRNDQDIIDAIDEYIFIKLYQKLDGKKEFYGYLKKVIDDELTIEVQEKTRKKEVIIKKGLIAKIRLAIKF